MVFRGFLKLFSVREQVDRNQDRECEIRLQFNVVDAKQDCYQFRLRLDG